MAKIPAHVPLCSLGVKACLDENYWSCETEQLYIKLHLV